MTAESYPDITARVQQAIGDVVPPVTAGPRDGTDFAVFLRRFLTRLPGRAARLITEHDRLLP